MSGFSSLGVARSALAASQRALDVTGQNIANANTPGYTRQRVELQSRTGVASYTFFSRGDGLGDGVDAATVTRVRDAFLERRGQLETGAAAQAAALDAAYRQVETTFGEPGTTGVQSLLTRASAAWSQLSTNPTDTTSRTAVLASASALANGLRTTSAGLDDQWSATRGSATDLLREANATLTRIADLNRAIQSAVSTGVGANELQDQRDTLVATVARSLGASAVETTDGMVNVVVGGSTVVGGVSAVRLALAGGTDAGTMTSAPVTLTMTPSGAVLGPGGTLGGQLAVLNTVLPTHRAALDAVAGALVGGVNAVLDTGYDQDGAPGQALYGGTSARDITVVITDPRKLAAAGSAPNGADASADGAVADAVAQLAGRAGSPDARYRDTITELGVAARSAAGASSAAAAIVTQVESSRQAVSGVSLDEELTNMLVFKQSYAAAARLVTVIDEMLDVLINRTGLVGR